MVKINFKEARDFLEKINKEDKIAIIHHDDLDGFSSGILLYNFCKNKCTDIEVFPMALRKPIEKELFNKFNKIIIADIPPFFVSKFANSKEILYIDHHQPIEIPEFILEYRIFKKYIPASRMVYELTEKENKAKQWLAVAGVIADVGYKYSENNSFLNRFLSENNLKLNEFKEKSVYPLISFLIYFSDDMKKAFEILKKIKDYKEVKKIKRYADEVETEIKSYNDNPQKNLEIINGINFYYFKPKFKIKSIVASHLSLKNPDKIFIFATPSENKIDLSARKQSDGINIIEILKTGISELENASVGGHIRAAGGFIQKKDLEKFKENLKKIKLN